MTDWNKIRNYFPALKKYVYLSTAGGGPMSTQTHAAGVSFYDQMLSDGDQPWSRWLEKVEAIRKTTAAFINADPSEIAFVQNSSQGMNYLAQMLKGPGGDGARHCRVVAMDDDFPTATIPFLKQGFPVTFVKSDDRCIIHPEALESAITADTKIMVMSSVQYATGFRQDLRRCGALCRKHGILLIVDASQSICAMPLDVKAAGMDYLVFSGNKWALSGYGVGVLYIRKELIDPAQFPVASWMSVKHPPLMDNRSLDFKETAAMLETGGPSFPNIFALGATIDLISEIGLHNIEERIAELTDYLLTKLRINGFTIVSPTEPPHRSGITIIAMENKKEVAKQLYRRNILVSVRHRGLRAALNFYNTVEDTDRFIAALKEITGR